uniref:Lymphocyte antigen 86 n=1 Tax=Falco tinnunculus TaxID=100819 RepID=A0A8C4UDZ7_FALTI
PNLSQLATALENTCTCCWLWQLSCQLSLPPVTREQHIDPQQDFAFSIDRCSDIATHTFNIRGAIVLRHNIKELYAKVDLIINGKTVLSYSEALCEPGHSKLIFCGKKKGEHLYYEGPVTLGIKEIPQGDYIISAKLTNEDHVTVACADFTVKNYLDYY